MHYEVIAQVNLLFAVLLASLTSLIADLGILASVGAQAARVHHLMKTLDNLQSGRSADGGPYDQGIELREKEAEEANTTQEPGAEGEGAICLELKDVTLRPPQGGLGVGVSKLSFMLRTGQSLLIRGDSGVGKSSLLRAIGGLWAAGEGSIRRCKASNCFFVPQEPYLCLGSLRANALYPRVGSDGATEELPVEQVLHSVNLGHLIGRHGLDTEVPLDTTLSGGEKQRLGMARLLLRPAGLQLALLDEATSALDSNNEAALYTLLRDKVRCHASVAHGESLDRFHTQRLWLRRSESGAAAGYIEEIGQVGGCEDPVSL